MNFEQVRFNMIEQQIRTWEVLDPRVLSLLNEVHRENYVAASQVALAFADIELPILRDDGSPSGEAMLFPKVEAKFLQALNLKPEQTVYQVGIGSGYLGALLAASCKHVYAVEIDAAIADQARRRLTANEVKNIQVVVGDGLKASSETYDAIVLTGSVPALPDSLLAMLKPNGTLIAVVGRMPVMKAVTVTKDAHGSVLTTELFETVLTPLKNSAVKPKFEF
jgi:protein-L-isoaspartate(D-aspartate) O-methyltransferase